MLEPVNAGRRAVGDLLERLQRLQREAVAPLGVAEIATMLCYSERTVKYVIQGVMSRLNLRNRLQAVVYAMRAGLI